jgi:hypothetical protein
MKKTINLIAIIALIALIAIATTSCADTSGTSTPDEGQLPARFVVLEDEDLGEYQSSIQVHNDSTSEFDRNNYTPVRHDSHMKYVVDRETRVVYIFMDKTGTRYSGMAMFPLYNADGTVMTYQGELPEVLYN